MGVAIAGLLEQRPDRLEIASVRLGQQVEIVEDDRLVARVVHAADEESLRRARTGPAAPDAPELAVVEHLGQCPSVGAAPRTTAGAAVVGRFVGVVQARRAVADEEHQAGKARGQSDLAEHLLGDLGHLVDGEAELPALGSWRRQRSLELEPGQRAESRRTGRACG